MFYDEVSVDVLVHFCMQIVGTLWLQIYKKIYKNKILILCNPTLNRYLYF